MRLVPVYVCLFLLGTLLSCSERQCPTEPDCCTFCYPLAVGNRWAYSRVDSMFNFRPGTFDVASLSTAQTRVVEITGTKMLPDYGLTFVLSETATSEYGDPYESESYYANRWYGLYLYAYRGAPSASPTTEASRKVRFKGREFRNIAEIVSFLEAGLDQRRTMDDTLYLESPPLRVLRYPLEVGAQWVLRQAGDPWRMDKLVLGKATVTVPAGDFTCYSIQTLSDLDDDGEWDDDVELIDYVSSSGLIRRYMLLRDLAETNEAGEVIGLFDAISDTKLVRFNIE